MKKYAIYRHLRAARRRSVEIEVRIWFTFTPGSPDTYDASRGGPGGWDPGYPPEVEFDSVERLDATPVPELDDWAREYLRGSGFDAAVGQCFTSHTRPLGVDNVGAR